MILCLLENLIWLQEAIREHQGALRPNLPLRPRPLHRRDRRRLLHRGRRPPPPRTGLAPQGRPRPRRRPVHPPRLGLRHCRIPVLLRCEVCIIWAVLKGKLLALFWFLHPEKNIIFLYPLSFGLTKRNRIFQPLDQDEANLGPRLHRDFARPPSWVRGCRRVGLFRSVCSSPQVGGGGHIQQRQLN